LPGIEVHRLSDLLFDCHESFEVASKYYEKAFGTTNPFSQTWFDFKRDILYCDWHVRNQTIPSGFIKGGV